MTSAYAIRLLESIISKLATSKFSIFYLVSVAEETGLRLALLETLKTTFVATKPNLYSLLYKSYILFKRSLPDHKQEVKKCLVSDLNNEPVNNIRYKFRCA